jgi:hypothetical protein
MVAEHIYALSFSGWMKILTACMLGTGSLLQKPVTTSDNSSSAAQEHIVMDLFKVSWDSGNVVPQQDNATVLWKRLLRIGACTCDVMLYGACAGDVRQQ